MELIKKLIINILIWLFSSTIIGGIVFVFVVSFFTEYIDDKTVEKVFGLAFVTSFVTIVIHLLVKEIRKKWKI